MAFLSPRKSLRKKKKKEKYITFSFPIKPNATKIPKVFKTHVKKNLKPDRFID